MQQAILRHFYPLDMIRRHAGEIELTDEQIAKLRKAVTEGNTEVEQLKWDLATSARKLLELVEQGATKEQVYAQMDVVFKYENKLKKKNLGLLIVIRDVLTPRQRKALDEIKAKAEPEPPGHGPGPGRGPGRRAKDPWSDRR
jgi:Spy/CpxP family protein refolding chaperone